MKHINKKRLIDCFMELAKIASPSGQEAEISKHLKDIMKSLGLDVASDDYGNLIAKLSGNGEPIILCAHMDTVAIGEGKSIKPEIKGDIITSDGSTILGADNKDSVSAIVEALTVICENNLVHRAVEIVFTREEEAISRGAQNLDYSMLSGKDCIIADSEKPFGTIIYGAPFCYRFNVRVEGARAHSKDPRRGVDVNKIIGKAFTTMPLGYIDEFTSSNIAFQISGLKGIIDDEKIFNQRICSEILPDRLSREGRNTVPDVAFVFGEVRGLKNELMKRNLEMIRLAFEGAASKFGGVSVFESIHLADGYLCDKNDSTYEMVAGIFKSQGVKVEYATSKGGSDANIFFFNGIKPIVIGSAHKNPHTVKEYLVIDDLVRLADFFVRFLTT